MKKERKIVDYQAEGKSKSKDFSIDKEGKIVNVKNVEAIDKKGALPRRIGAVVLWLCAIACEVVAILNVVNKLELPKFSQLTWLIVLIVLDLIFVLFTSWINMISFFP